MAKAQGKPVLTVVVAFEIDESEARALDALADNDADTLSSGVRSLRDHEAGLNTFLQTIRDIVRPAIVTADKARDLLEGAK
jgi:hypothetical protein